MKTRTLLLLTILISAQISMVALKHLRNSNEMRFAETELEKQLPPNPSIQQLKNSARTFAKAAEVKATSLMNRINRHPESEKMVIPVLTTNKRETPDLRIDYPNVAKLDKMMDLATTAHGAVASERRSQEIRGNAYY